MPPIQRPTAIFQVGTGDSQVKANEPDRSSAPSTASPITRQVTGSTRPNRAVDATAAKASAASLVEVGAMKPEQQRGGRRDEDPEPARGPGRHGPQRVAGRWRPAGPERRRWGRGRHRTSSRNRLSSESSSGRTSVRWTPRSRAARGSSTASSLARVVEITRSPPSSVDAGDDLVAEQGGGQAPAVGGPHEHLAGHVVHGVADRAVAAGGGQPAAHDHDHPLGHRLHLVEHVRAHDDRAALVAQATEQLDEAEALHGVGAVERFVEHQHERVLHQRRRPPCCAGACPC